MEHGAAAHGESIVVDCPAGYNGSVTLACNDFHFSVNRGKCGRRCAPGTGHFPMGEDLLVVDYPDMDDGENFAMECPSPFAGSMGFKCQDGVVLARGHECRPARPCPAGDFLLGHAKVSYSAMDHGIMEPSSCPAGFEGQYFLQCQDGEVIQKHNSSCASPFPLGLDVRLR